MKTSIISWILRQSWPAFILVACITLSGLTLANYHYAKVVPGGVDFLLNWNGAKMFFQQGEDPYNLASLNIVQDKIKEISSPWEPDQVQFISPLYVFILFFPFIFVPDYILARALWMTVLELALVMQVLLSLKLVNWKPGKIIFAMLIGLTLFGFHSFESLVKGDLTILMALFITCGIFCIQFGWDELAGIMFAMTTITLNSIIIFLLYIFFWSLRNRRFKILIWFFVTMFILIFVFILLMPSWPLQFLRALFISFNENPIHLLGNELGLLLPGIGLRLGWILTGITFILVIIEWRLSLKYELRGFLWAAMFTLTGGVWLGFWIEARNLIFCMPVLVLIFSFWVDRWQRIGKWIVEATILVSLFGGWILYLAAVGGYKVHNAITIALIPVMLMFSLYWVKWWAVQSTKTWLEAFYGQENPPNR